MSRNFSDGNVFRVYFRLRKTQSSRAIICLLGESGTKKVFLKRSNLTRKCAESKGSSDKIWFISRSPNMSSVVWKNNSPLSRDGFWDISTFLSHPLPYPTTIFFPSRLHSSSQQPAIICLCAYFLFMGSRGGRDRLVSFIIAHSE